MAKHAAQVMKEALRLPEEERAELVCDLLDSFGVPPSHSEKSEEEWVIEIERRARVAVSGEPGLPWDEMRTSIERRLSDR